MTQSHETIHNIHAQVLDSCIRENHLVQKIPLYFPLQAQPEPVSVACDITFINESKVPWHAVMHCFNSESSRSPGHPIGVRSTQFASPMAHSDSTWILLSSTPQQADWKVSPSLTFSKPCLDWPTVFGLLDLPQGTIRHSLLWEVYISGPE